MEITPLEIIESKIYFIRGHKVMLDMDLAILYGVPIKVLNQAVRRNASRFPSDFMFRITGNEARSLRSQFVTLKRGQHRKYLPYAFTEQGVSMLSSVLKSERAIQVNIAIMRVFARVKELFVRREDIATKVSELEERIDTHDLNIVAIFDAIKQLVDPKKQRARIGFKPKT